jgi:hypothetical protein
MLAELILGNVRGLHTDSGMGGGKLGKLMHAYFVII